MGVCAISRPRGRPSTTDVLTTDEKIQSEINSLRHELTFEDSKNLVLMISFASDEMIRETMKYPEVLFMDCTARVNKQKREFFFSVIRTPSGKYHLSNMTVIPSGNTDIDVFVFDSEVISYHNHVLSICSREVLGIQVYIQGLISIFIWITDHSKE